MAEKKTDILTACDLKKDLESNSGVKGCRVSVVEMPQRSSQIDTHMKIKGISQIYNIHYKEGGMRFWKAFDIGKGERMVQDHMPSAEIPKVKVVQAFPEACLSSGTMEFQTHWRGKDLTYRYWKRWKGCIFWVPYWRVYLLFWFWNRAPEAPRCRKSCPSLTQGVGSIWLHKASLCWCGKWWTIKATFRV